ncbi:MAG TPA: MarR family transcriptional regulator [Opitutaceae bacterium]|nr:MarR family transcriptional regulator [Opitutaceae bacterium]
MPINPGFDFINQVLATSETLLRESRKFFRPLGVTEAQFNVLNVLAGAPDGVSQRELSDVLVVDRSNVTTLLDRMEKAGLVRRADHPSDRRVYQIFLTEKGRKLWARVHPLYLRAVAHVTGGLSARQMQECSETLRALAASAVKWRKK